MSTWQAAIGQTLSGQQFYNMWYFENPAMTEALLEEALSELLGQYLAYIVPNQTDNLQYNHVMLKRVDIADQFQAPWSDFVPFLGSSISQPQATQVAFGMSMRSYSTKPNKGYKYFPGFTAANLATDGTVWNTATMGRVASFGDAIVSWNTNYPIKARIAIVRYVAASRSYLFPNTIHVCTPKVIPCALRRRKMGVGM